jgi:MerR family transcriptional regulator, light-induced transcriptional regulator
MNNVKNTFSIKDLENLSGIKAHTIRIWEKRYNILEPMRTDTNIRMYDITNLQRLLNITLLHDHGYKISKISQFPKEQISQLVHEITTVKNAKSHAISAFKMAMMNFDQSLFFKTYNNLLADTSFRDIFYEVFIPLLHEIGVLWQTDTISPAHEHFISYLIKQKLLSNTEKLQTKEPTNHDKIFILYLPLNEIHELGLMYLNYEILLHGYKTIFLGESIPLECLKDISNQFENITFVCYMTIEPNREEINNYVEQIRKEFENTDTHFWFIGKMTAHLNPALLTPHIQIHTSIAALTDKL